MFLSAVWTPIHLQKIYWFASDVMLYFYDLFQYKIICILNDFKT